MSDQRLTKAQITSLVRQAGFPEEVVPTMVGIAGGESGFKPTAHNPDASTGDNSYGLFQINMLGAMGPERRQLFGIESNEELFDPLKNVKAAKAIYDRQGLNAWSVYSSGAYKDNLPTEADLQGAALPATPLTSSTQPTTAESGGNVLNVYFDKGSKHQGKKDKAKSLVEEMKEQIMSNMLVQAMDPLAGMGMPGMTTGAFNPLSFLDS